MFKSQPDNPTFQTLSTEMNQAVTSHSSMCSAGMWVCLVLRAPVYGFKGKETGLPETFGGSQKTHPLCHLWPERPANGGP